MDADERLLEAVIEFVNSYAIETPEDVKLLIKHLQSQSVFSITDIKD